MPSNSQEKGEKASFMYCHDSISTKNRENIEYQIYGTNYRPSSRNFWLISDAIDVKQDDLISSYRDRRTNVVWRIWSPKVQIHIWYQCGGASDGRIISCIENLAAKCEWHQTLRQLSKRSYSPGEHVLGHYVMCLPRNINPSQPLTDFSRIIQISHTHDNIEHVLRWTFLGFLRYL